MPIGPIRALLILAALCLATSAHAQLTTPIFTDDSPRALDGLSRAAELASAGNTYEAAGIVQDLLEREADKTIPRRNDANLFVSVRTAAHEALLADKDLLASYRDRAQPAAEMRLKSGDFRSVEAAYFLTPAGLEAALHLAQHQLQHARFNAALITIAQLESHPDFPANKARAAKLAALILSYIDNPESPAAQAVRNWIEQEPQPALKPPASTGKTPNDNWPPLDIEGMLPRPLCQEFFGFERARGRSVSVEESVPDAARYLDVWPTIQGEDIFISDGQQVTAFNRFTLSERWNTLLPAFTGRAKEIGTSGDEPAAVAVENDWLVAISANQSARSRNRIPRTLYALDADDGRIIWSRQLAEFDNSVLTEADFLGPPLIHEGLAIVPATKDITERRLEAALATGIDLRTGELQWARQLAGSGQLPYGTGAPARSIPIIQDGILYHADQIGVISALEADTGRLRWIRTVPRNLRQTRPTGAAWNIRSIVIAQGKVIALNSDHTQLLVLDAQTGEQLFTLSTRTLNDPDYLLRLGEFLIGVRHGSITAAPLQDILEGRPGTDWPVLAVDDPGIRGRVVVAGDQLVVPVIDGFLLVPVARDKALPARRVALDRSGNLIPIGSQVIAVDDRQVHTYLVWETAEQLLRDRMESNPDDPSAAVTYAELAYRANRHDRIIEAIDIALNAIERDPLNTKSEFARARLFRAVLAMASPPADAAPQAILKPDIREQVIDRLGRAAYSPMEQVAYLMTAADHYAATDRPERAVEFYQRVLLNDALAQQSFVEQDKSSLAQFAATERLREVVAEAGREIYQPYDDEARWCLEALADSRDPADFERIARRYPLSSTASAAVIQAAAILDRQGRPNRAIRALRVGIESLETGWQPDPQRRGELLGRTITQLERAGRLREAIKLIERTERDHPRLALTEGGSPIDTAALLTRMRAAVETEFERPKLGHTLTNSRDVIGWMIHPPQDPTGQMPTDSVFVLSTEGKITLWRTRGEDGRLRAAWDEIENEMLLRTDREFAYMLRSTGTEPDGDHNIIKRRLSDGEEVWASPPVAEELKLALNFGVGTEPVAQAAERIAARTLLYVFDARTLIIASRKGKSLAIDLVSGRVLWKNERTLASVTDIVVAGGIVAIGGTDANPADLDESGAILALDARTGEVISKTALSAPVIWLKANPAGSVLSGIAGGIVAVDPFLNQVLWKETVPQELITEPILAKEGHVLVRDSNNNLIRYNLDATNTAQRRQPLDTRNRLGRTRMQLTTLDMGDKTLLSSERGIVLYDAQGNVAGVDVRETNQNIIPAQAGADVLVSIDAVSEAELDEPNPLQDNTAIHTVRVYSANSCKLLSTTPVEFGRSMRGALTIALVDGKILVTSDRMTTIIDAPAEQGATP